ncbi:Fibronectin type III-like domain-containing protein [Cynara cardunculus var. scolymus]|uniref:Fibronectin type III-like domain-containing protein n=1 Tax=Cynara cardunculus var. scolymus TaxID=59895 RepID=A0A103XX67_CYNCS|nr:Fibronectin type III-like domain-containing protein [Cynara cardunculus var. scolymus]
MRLNSSIQLLLCLTVSILLLTESTQPPYACDSSNAATKSFPFCKTTLPISARVRDLVSRLTLDEKISQLVNTAPAIPRLGIPAYEWWSEALHGLSSPPPLSMPDYGTESARDPRWGRGQETPGEDPLVSGKYAISYVRGVQGDNFEGGGIKDGHLQASACCKHFTAYDLDHWKGVDRFGYDAKVTKQDLVDTYQPPFHNCIQHAQASGIMCAYNRVNGVPNCADYNLLTNIARKQWDCDAVSIIYDVHKYAKTPEDAVAEVLKAGMDVDCGSYMQNHTKSAVQKKKVLESDIDRALSNLFTMRMRLGLFNGNPASLPYGSIGPNQVCSKAHQDLALEAARNGIVLLKNSAKLLPFKKTISSLAVIGPNANSAYTLVGNYAGPPCKSIEPLKALQNYVKNTQYIKGCNFVNCTSASIDEAVKVAKSVDYVVLFMGLDQGQERESFDRVDLVLPGQQQALITSVAKAAKRPVVLVLVCGGPVDISFAKHDPKIGGILWAGYPGESGGIALAEIIFGDHNPGGKLPITWYPKEFVKIPMTDMRMRPEPSSGYPGRTYRFYTGRKVYQFGYGLSYSKYTYDFVSVTQNKLSLSQISGTGSTLQNSESVHYTSVVDMETESCEKAKFSATVGVQNHGEMDGKHAVLLFVKHDKAGNGKPMKQLAAFESVKTGSGERVEVEFVVSPCEHFGTANEDGLMVIEEGSRYLVVGDQQYAITVLP